MKATISKVAFFRCKYELSEEERKVQMLDGARGNIVVKALLYKQEVRGFETRQH
jgi:hypothetical protein